MGVNTRFTDEDTEVQRSEEPCPRPRSRRVAEPGLTRSHTCPRRGRATALVICLEGRALSTRQKYSGVKKSRSRAASQGVQEGRGRVARR